MIAAEPPSATGQPCRGPAAVSITADRRGGGPVERAEDVGGRAGEQRPGLRRPEPAGQRRSAGQRRRAGRTGPSGAGGRATRTTGRARRRPGRRSRRRAARTCAARPARPRPGPAQVSSRSSAPSRRRSRRRAGGPGRSRGSTRPGRARRAAATTRNGEATPNGCTAEHTSWSTPGTVSSALRVPPPMVSAPSSTVTERPAWASAHRGGQPVGPGADDDRVERPSRGRERVVVLR